MAGHHVGLGKLHLGLAGPPHLCGDELVDGPGLAELLPVPVQHGDLSEGRAGLVFGPLGETDPGVFVVNVTGSQQNPGNLTPGFSVKLNQLDHRHYCSVGLVSAQLSTHVAALWTSVTGLAEARS